MTERILVCGLTYRNTFLLFAGLCLFCLLFQYRFNYASISKCFSSKGYVATRVVERVYFELPPSSPSPRPNTKLFTTDEPTSTLASAFTLTSPIPTKCQPQNYVVFLKTHKTGSSTITNILNRYADWNNLTMLLPYDKQFYSFNWPNKFRLSYAKDNHGRMPNILANHARYSRKSMNLLFPRARTSYITILREPVRQWESMFSYMSFPYILNIRDKRDPMDFFLKNPPSLQNIKKNARRFPSINLIKNPLFFDLGLDYKYYGNVTMMKRAMKTIDSDFDLVLMMDHFDESMVLLKRRLCWSIDDVVFFKTNERLNKNKRVLTTEQENLIKRWNSGDIALYDHFVSKFWKEIEKEGPDFYDDLQTLKERKKYYFKACVEKEAVTEAYTSVFVKGYAIRKNLTGDLKLYCERMLRNELAYQDYFKAKYFKKIDSLEGVTIENFDDQLEEVDIDIELGSNWGEEGLSYNYGLPPKNSKQPSSSNSKKEGKDEEESAGRSSAHSRRITTDSHKESEITVVDESSISSKIISGKIPKEKVRQSVKLKPTVAMKQKMTGSKEIATNPITLGNVGSSKLTTLAQHMDELDRASTAFLDIREVETTEAVTTEPTKVPTKTEKEIPNRVKSKRKKPSPTPTNSYTRFEGSSQTVVPVESANKVLDKDDPKRFDGRSIIASKKNSKFKKGNKISS